MLRAGLLVGIVGVVATGCISTGFPSQGAVIHAKNKVAPAMVHVRPVKEVFNRGERKEVSVLGSGFIISNDGYVVTNEHVAGSSDYVRCVLYDKTEVDAEIIGVDTFTDIAVLRLKTDRTDLPTVRLGTSSDLDSGEFVLALGSPHGLSRSVSAGIISVTDRNLESMGSTGAPYNNWIQTDAAINPGNSGGPLVNLDGEVIGINTRKLSGADNVGFAIPIDIAKQVIANLIEHGKVPRSTIGVALQGMTQYTDDPSVPGVLIADVNPLSPAADSEIQPGDVLLSIDGLGTNAHFTEDLPAIRKQIADLPVGSMVTLSLMRENKPVEVMVTTVELGARRGEQNEFPSWGFSVSELTQQIAKRAQLEKAEGVLVTGVRVGSPAGIVQLNRGDIILRVDDVTVTSLTQFNDLYNERIETDQEFVLLWIKRGALTMFKLLKVKSTNGEAS